MTNDDSSGYWAYMAGMRDLGVGGSKGVSGVGVMPPSLPSQPFQPFNSHSSSNSESDASGEYDLDVMADKQSDQGSQFTHSQPTHVDVQSASASRNLRETRIRSDLTSASPSYINNTLTQRTKRDKQGQNPKITHTTHRGHSLRCAYCVGDYSYNYKTQKPESMVTCAQCASSGKSF